jgi:hypothetical protein
MGSDYAIEFVGPFSWLGEVNAPSLFGDAVGKRSGIYLWAIEIENGFLVYYVGQTGRTFSQRMKEHLKEHLAGFYHLNDPDEFRKGEKVSVWPGLYDVDTRVSLPVLGEKHPNLSEIIYRLSHQYRFFFASIDAQPRVVERIESAIADYLYKQDGTVGSFQEKGIRYRPRWNSESPVNVSIAVNKNLIGFPSNLIA